MLKGILGRKCIREKKDRKKTWEQKWLHEIFNLYC